MCWPPTASCASALFPAVRCRWRQIAIAIPKGREAAMEYLRRFVEEAQSSGLLSEAAERAGLRGVLKSQ
jgi:hypothetical protein